MKSPASAHLGYIDGLRAVALLAVVTFHAQMHAEIGSSFAPFYRLGFHGVDLFFVISGFCLAYPYIARHMVDGSDRFSAIDFFAKRVVRIAPPYYVALALFTVLPFIPGLRHAIALTYPSFVLPHVAAALREMLFLDANGTPHNGSFWTLAVEMRWYLMFPLLLKVWSRMPRVFLALGLTLAALVPMTRFASFDASVLPAFMLGIIAAWLRLRLTADNTGAVPRLWVPSRLSSSPAVRISVAVVGGFALLALAARFEPALSFGYKAQPLWQGVCFAFVVAIGSVPSLAKLFSLAPLRFIGHASYSIYLVHEPIISYLEQARGITPLPAATMALALGLCFWALVERPLLKRRNREAMLRFVRPIITRAFDFLVQPKILTVKSETSFSATRASSSRILS